MPGGDRTGPNGMGPMTGRSLGYCSNRGNGFIGRLGRFCGFGRGFGAGRGAGRGWNRGYGFANVPPRYESEAEALAAQADILQSELDAVKARLNEINKK